MRRGACLRAQRGAAGGWIDAAACRRRRTKRLRRCARSSRRSARSPRQRPFPLRRCWLPHRGAAMRHYGMRGCVAARDAATPSLRLLHAKRFGAAPFSLAHAAGWLHAQAAAAASRAAEARLRLDADAALRAHRDEAERTRPVAAAAVAGGMISVAADVGLMQARLALYAMDARGARDGVQRCRAMPRKRAP